MHEKIAIEYIRLIHSIAHTSFPLLLVFMQLEMLHRTNIKRLVNISSRCIFSHFFYWLSIDLLLIHKTVPYWKARIWPNILQK